MSRFDVHQLAEAPDQLVIDVQSDFLSMIGSRIVVPLATSTRLPQETLGRLYPVIPVHGRDYLFVTPDLTSVLDGQLGAKIANVEAEHRDDITAALDFLLTGF